MKIDFTQPLQGITGELLNDEENKPWTVYRGALGALTANYPDEQIRGEEKFARSELAKKVHKSIANDTIDFTIEEVAKIKELIGKAWSTVLVGSMWEELEKQTSK